MPQLLWKAGCSRRDDQVDDYMRFLSQTARAKLTVINQQRVSGSQYRFTCAIRRANHDYLRQLPMCIIGRRLSPIIPGMAHVHRLYTGIMRNAYVSAKKRDACAIDTIESRRPGARTRWKEIPMNTAKCFAAPLLSAFVRIRTHSPTPTTLIERS